MNAAPVERRWDRGAWITLAFVVSLALVSAATSIAVLRLPSEGCVVDAPSGMSQMLRACYGERATPLRPGDELLAAGGIALVIEEDEFWTRTRRPEGWAAGATIEYTIRRDGALLTLPVPIDPLGWSGVRQVFAYTATADAGEYVLYRRIWGVRIAMPATWPALRPAATARPPAPT